MEILFQRNKQTSIKEKAKKKDRRKSKVFKRGGWTESKEQRWNFEREEKRKNKETKHNRKKRRI